MNSPEGRLTLYFNWQNAKVLAKVPKQSPHRMDGYAAHASVAIYTGREKAYLDSHIHICNAYIHSGHT